jgi:hypothetical protein
MLGMTLEQLTRLRWAVRAALLLGVAASVVANVLHAVDNPVSQAIAAWPPCALLLTVELISRVPVHRKLLAAARLLATATIAGIAAWVSYWHMAGVAARYGETGASPYLLPLSVDGLIIVASICLVELSGRIQDAGRAAELAHTESPAQSPEGAGEAEGTSAADGPSAPGASSDSGAAVAAEPPAQRVRQGQRTAQDIEAAVRAIRAARPDLSQRRIAALAGTSPTNAGRILREARGAAAAQQEETETEHVEPATAAP